MQCVRGIRVGAQSYRVGAHILHTYLASRFGNQTRHISWNADLGTIPGNQIWKSHVDINNWKADLDGNFAKHICGIKVGHDFGTQSRNTKLERKFGNHT